MTNQNGLKVIEKEQFCFDILNQLLDDFNLHLDDYTKLVNQIWDANTHLKIDGILSFLQGSLLICMKEGLKKYD